MRNNYYIWSNELPTDEKVLDEYRKAYAETYGIPLEEVMDIDEYTLDIFIAQELDRDYDDEVSNIRCHEKHHGTKQYVVLASIGKWNGTYDGGKIITGMVPTFQQCAEGLDYVRVYFKNGLLRILGAHHDGINSFRIRELTPAGEQYIENHPFMDDRELHRVLFNSSKYSHRVSIFHEIYGC